MSIYFSVNYRITDPEGIAKYREKVLPLLMQSGCEILVTNDEVEVIEGSIAPTLVILKFES